MSYATSTPQRTEFFDINELLDAVLAVEQDWTDDHSIERQDVNGNYEPGNCYWATAVQQASNKRNNVFHEYQGVRLTETELSRRVGISPQVIRNRLAQGMTVDAAVSKPVTPIRYTHNGESLTLKEWSEKTGISGSALCNRVVVGGWPFDKAISKK